MDANFFKDYRIVNELNRIQGRCGSQQNPWARRKKKRG
jgi:hypothetical protein